VKLYICWGTFPTPRPGGHPCRNAYEALRAAGHDPEIVKTYGFGPLPNLTSGRREVQRLTDQSWVPILVTDEGQVIEESKRIVAWAREHPVTADAA
jgi:glutathione S-transferase-like protein